MRLLLLPKYGPLGNSSRYRLYAYVPFLEECGFECKSQLLLTDAYVKAIYDPYSPARAVARLTPQIIAAYARRFVSLVRDARSYDAILLQYEALPYLPMAFERALFRSNPRVAVDYDDAVNVHYADHGNAAVRLLLRSKIGEVVRASRGVVVGNHTLRAWAGQINPHVTLVPTSIDLKRYADQHAVAKPAKPIIGWIGTPHTAKFLYLLQEPLRALRAEQDFTLRVIGVPGFRMTGVDVEAVPWSPETEVRDLIGCDVGVMPLFDGSFERGKSALKIIQYLAAGVPAVASPVGANCDVIADGYNGFLAASPDDWLRKIRVLISQPETAREFARRGRRLVEQEYSLQSNAPKLASILKVVAGS